MPAAASAVLGAKRPREDVPGTRNGSDLSTACSYSSNAAIIEIIHGITQSEAEAYERQIVGLAASCQNMDMLLSSPLFRHKAHRLCVPCLDGFSFSGPAEVGVVQLVANNGETLVFTSDLTAPVNVSPAVGQRVCIGDVVLLQRLTVRNNHDDGDPAMEEEGVEIKEEHMTSTKTAIVEFLTLDPMALSDISDWWHAASWNAVASIKWMQKLLSCPPGLAQLTCIMHSILGVTEEPGNAAEERGLPVDDWGRSLQLPLLLQHFGKMEGTALHRMQHLKKVIFSMLRLYVAILSNAESIMAIPRVVERVVYQFLASPLFVEGLSVVLPQMAGSISESAWVGGQQTMLDAMGLALCHVNREGKPINGEKEEKMLQEARESAERGFLTVLHRISALWLSNRTGKQSPSSQAAAQLVEEMIRTGVFRRVTQWVRNRERMVDPLNLVDKVHRPPNLQEIKGLHGLMENTVKEMITAMMQTYIPYLRQETLRFVECAMLAAYAELYGPASRAVNKCMEAMASEVVEETGSFHQVQQWHRRRPQIKCVEQPAFRSCFSDYTLAEVQLNAMFGLPFSLSLHAAGASETLHQLQETTSSFGYILLLLSRRTFIFPVIICNAGINDNEKKPDRNDGDGVNSVVTLTAYVLRDRDMLPSLVAASASTSTARNGLPEAWLFCNDDHHCLGMGTNDQYHQHHSPIGDPPPRFFPPGTPAVSYVFYISHLQTLRARLLREERWGSCGAGRFRNVQGKGCSAVPKGGVLWWSSGDDGGGSNGSGGGDSGSGDFFIHSTPLAGESELVQRCLAELTGCTSLTASQVECLHSLTSVCSGVRTLVGAVGSGKTTLMHAASLTRGQVQKMLRKQHQPNWYAIIKHSTETLSARVAELDEIEDMDDLFRAVDGTSVRDLPEEVVNIALSHIDEHVCLSEKLRQCHAPMLLRPKALPHAPPPPHAMRILQDSKALDQYQTLESIVVQSQQRSLNAPIVALLNTCLQTLKRLCDVINSMRLATEDNTALGEGEWKLFIELLPWIMSRKERCDTVAEAARRGKEWSSYISEDLWDAATVVTSGDVVVGGGGMWKSLEPATKSFNAVTLPNASRSLCEYGRSEAAGWRAVFGEKQGDLLCFLQHLLMDEVQHLFTLFLDVVYGVAATSETSKVTVVTATGQTLLQELPLLRVWQPRHIVVDDYDHLDDSHYLTLSPASSIIISQQKESLMQHEHHISLALLRTLQKTLQGTSLSSTVLLTESLRFQNPVLQKVVQLCRNTPVASYVAPRRGAVSARLNNSNNNKSSSIGGGDVDNKNNDDDDDDDDNLEGMLSRGVLPGLSSPSCVEIWTHAIDLSASVVCDGLAAAVVRNRVLSIDPEMVVTVYCGFKEDKDALLEGMMLAPQDGRIDAVASVSILPFFLNAFMERDKECDIAVLCLSGLSRRLRCFSAPERQQEWSRLMKERSFIEHVEWWLWKAASYARRGVLLIGSKELFCILDVLRRLENFVLRKRVQHNYWIPPEAKGAVLGLRCPDHANCRQLAILTHSDYSGCRVRFVGVQRCRSLCLMPYDDCTNPSHACLHTCHASSTPDSDDGEKGERETLLHDRCPFPCSKPQLCGHMCVRQCGEPCLPCEFVGLRELPCGQRVVSGMSESGPVLTLVHHFQRSRCGEAPQPCEERVLLRCLRCGEKNPMFCHEVVARGGMESATISELECAGCVALYNRVAREFGIPELIQSATMATGNLPSEELPEAAQDKLQKLQGFAAKKAQLMLQKEALETMRGNETSEFQKQQEVYKRLRKQQEVELHAHHQRVQESIQSWAKTLKQKYEVQMGLNEAMDTELPLMISEAVAEEERQQLHCFM